MLSLLELSMEVESGLKTINLNVNELYQNTETQVPPALNELHRSNVQTIAACMPLAPTFI